LEGGTVLLKAVPYFPRLDAVKKVPTFGTVRNLLDEIARRKAVDFLAKVADAEPLAQDLTRIVEADRLVEVRNDEEVLEREHDNYVGVIASFDIIVSTCMTGARDLPAL